MDIFIQGLRISISGIVITFAFLGSLIVVMVLLREIFKPPPKEIAPETPAPAKDVERMRAAAVAVAVAILKSEQTADAGLGRVLESPPGRWWGAAHMRGQDGYGQSQDYRQSQSARVPGRSK